MMHGKPYNYQAMHGIDLEERIRLWFEKMVDIELVENWKTHVRTFVGIFRLSRQDLIQDIREEPQYPAEVKRCLDGQSSLADLRKVVFAFEFRKLTGMDKTEADLIVNQLFEDCGLLKLTENGQDEKGNLLHNPPVIQSVTREESVSSSELEMSYTSAFPALPISKINKLTAREAIPSFWQMRSPLRSNPSVQPLKSNACTQDSSHEKAPTPLNRKIRTGGKENEYGTISAELKRKPSKSKELRSKREDLIASEQQIKEQTDYLTVMSKYLKSMLGVQGKGSNELGAVTTDNKKDADGQTQPESGSLGTQTVSEADMAWDPGHLREPSCLGRLSSSQNQRSSSEPQLAEQKPKVDSRLSDQGSSSPLTSPSSLLKAKDLSFRTPEVTHKHKLAKHSEVDNFQSLDNIDSSTMSEHIWSQIEGTPPIWPRLDPGICVAAWKIYDLDTSISHCDDQQQYLMRLPRYMTAHLEPQLQQTNCTADIKSCLKGASVVADSPSMIERPIDQVFGFPERNKQSNSQCTLPFGGHSLQASEELHTAVQFSSSVDHHHHQEVNNFLFYESTQQQEHLREYSLFGYTRGQLSEQAPSDPSRRCTGDRENPSEPLPFSSESFSEAQSFQTASSDEDRGHRVRSEHSDFSAPFPHSRSDSEKNDQLDPFRNESPSAGLQQNLQVDQDKHLHELPSVESTSSQRVLRCNCKGACNCKSIHELKVRSDDSKGGVSNDYNWNVFTCSPRRKQVSQDASKKASDSGLDHVPGESAFMQMNSLSKLRFKRSVANQCPHQSHSSAFTPRTAPACSVENASHRQREKMRKNHLEVIKRVEEEPGLWGEYAWEKEVPETKGTQTEDCKDVGANLAPAPVVPVPVQPVPVVEESPKKVYEEKHWKDLMPLSEEDVQRDRLHHARMQAEKLGSPDYEQLDVAAMERTELADFQLLSEPSASLHVLHNQAVYVTDLEKAWLSESYRRLGKSRGRRPLHPHKPCTFFLEGCCYRSDCKFSHDINTITCHFWEAGQCFKGELCPFLHGYSDDLIGCDLGEEFDVTRADFPILSRKDVRLNSAPAPKKRRNKKNSVHRLQLPRGT